MSTGSKNCNIFLKNKDTESEKDASGESRSILISGFEEIFQDSKNIDIVGVQEIENQNVTVNILNKLDANSAVFVNSTWEFEKKRTSMWQGLVSMNVILDVYLLDVSGLFLSGSYSIPSQRIPIRKWSEEQSFKNKNLQRIAKKIVSKWDPMEIRNFINSRK